MGNKRLAINLIANVISYASGILISFILTPYLINTLGKEVYGFYPLANNFISYMSIISVALNSMSSRFITIEITKKNYEKANKYYSSIFYANLILAFFLFMVMSIIIIFLNKILVIPRDLIIDIRILFSLIFISMLINIILSVFGVAVFVKNRIDLRSIAEIIRGIIRILLFIGLFTLLKPNIIYIGIVTLVLEILYSGIHYMFTKKLLPQIKIKRENFDILYVKEIVVSGIWNSINQLGSNLLYGMDLVIGNIFLGAQASGELSIVHTVPNFVNGIITMLTGVFMPRITQKYAMEDIGELVKEVRLSQKIMGLITNVPICIFIVFGSEFFDLWVPGNNTSRLQIISMMTIAHLILVGVVWPISNLNIVMNRLKIPSLFMIGNGIINICLMIALLTYSNVGIYAIPLTTMLISFIWFGIFIPIYPCKKLGIKKTTFYPAIIKTLISVPIIIGMSFFVKGFFVINSWISFFLIGGLCGIIGIFINILIILNPKEILYYIKKVIK